MLIIFAVSFFYILYIYISNFILFQILISSKVNTFLVFIHSSDEVLKTNEDQQGRSLINPEESNQGFFPYLLSCLCFKKYYRLKLPKINKQNFNNFINNKLNFFEKNKL